MRRVLISTLMALACATATAGDVAVDTRLPASAGLITTSEGTRWHDLAVIGTDGRRDILVTCNGKRVTIARALVAEDDTSAAEALPALLARAESAGLASDQLRLERGLITGLHLRSDAILLLSDAVLRRSTCELPDASELREALRRAGEQVAKELGHSRLSPSGRQAVVRVLALVDQERIGEDECSPQFLRQLLASGWLDAELSSLPSWMGFAHALAEARLLRPYERWQGDEQELVELRDAFSRRVFVRRTPQGNARLQAHHTGSQGGAPRMVVHHFAAAVDPLQAGLPDSAEVWWGRRRLLRWDPQRMDVDQERWRQALPDDGPGTGGDTVVAWRPPHVILGDAMDRILALATSHGVLRPASGTSEDSERFLRDAARLLPDAQHLDLLGQYLFSYVHDSPDPQRPWLVGMRGCTGEIHQTVAETVATVNGGVMRGDCDDLSELYHELLTRQGHLPQVFNLPRHAACGWARQQGDQWTTHVLHTGQPLAFQAETLAESVAQAFEHFRDPGSDRGTQVNLLLRFAGENTRAQYSLDSRILRDGDYARTMIAVQRDWHFHTYAQGIATMRRLIAAGDDSAANWGELAGLYRRTAQWDEALVCQRHSIERTTDPVARFQARLTEARLAAAAKYHQEVAKQVPSLLSELDRTYAGAAHERDRRLALSAVFDLLDREAHRDLRSELLTKRLLPPVEKSLTDLLPWARSRFDRRTWDTRWREVREQAGRLVGIILVDARMRGAAALAEDPVLQRQVVFAERWLSGLSMLPGGERSEIMQGYASLGYLGQTLVGDEVFNALLARSIEPVAWSEDHQRSSNGPAQLARDAAWIRVSVPFWKGRLLTLLRESESDPSAPVTTDSLRDAAAGLLRAVRACERLEIVSPSYERELLYARLLDGMLGPDDQSLDQVLRDAAERRDRQTDGMVTDLVVTLAAHLGPHRFRHLLARWDALAATKPGYFAIAWGCANDGQVAQALEVGALAAAKHADDPAFVAEFAYLQHVLAGGTKP
jgi:hypothetical protein